MQKASITYLKLSECLLARKTCETLQARQNHSVEPAKEDILPSCKSHNCRVSIAVLAVERLRFRTDKHVTCKQPNQPPTSASSPLSADFNPATAAVFIATSAVSTRLVLGLFAASLGSFLRRATILHLMLFLSHATALLPPFTNPKIAGLGCTIALARLCVCRELFLCNAPSTIQEITNRYYGHLYLLQPVFREERTSETSYTHLSIYNTVFYWIN